MTSSIFSISIALFLSSSKAFAVMTMIRISVFFLSLFRALNNKPCFFQKKDV